MVALKDPAGFEAFQNSLTSFPLLGVYDHCWLLETYWYWYDSVGGLQYEINHKILIF